MERREDISMSHSCPCGPLSHWEKFAVGNEDAVGGGGREGKLSGNVALALFSGKLTYQEEDQMSRNTVISCCCFSPILDLTSWSPFHHTWTRNPQTQCCHLRSP